MRWPITIVVLSLVLAISLGLYRLKSEVQRLERRLSVATAQLEENRHNSRILAAEWSFLSQPSRVQTLAGRYLALAPLTPEQIGGLASLPLNANAIRDAGKPGNDGARDEAVRNNGREQSVAPPLPGWKPVKPRPTGRIILASSGRQP
ncbi:MAG: hypothetical protein ISR50_12435 [Alphaproteobacteria bacterium]|nr:hypothetical protein [Alphaproteobacteria bacterium]